MSLETITSSNTITSVYNEKPGICNSNCSYIYNKYENASDALIKNGHESLHHLNDCGLFVDTPSFLHKKLLQMHQYNQNDRSKKGNNIENMRTPITSAEKLRKLVNRSYSDSHLSEKAKLSSSEIGSNKGGTSFFDDFDAHYCVRYNEQGIKYGCNNIISRYDNCGLGYDTNGFDRNNSSMSLSQVKKVLLDYFDSSQKKNKSEENKKDNFDNNNNNKTMENALNPHNINEKIYDFRSRFLFSYLNYSKQSINQSRSQNLDELMNKGLSFNDNKQDSTFCNNKENFIEENPSIAIDEKTGIRWNDESIVSNTNASNISSEIQDTLKNLSRNRNIIGQKFRFKKYRIGSQNSNITHQDTKSFFNTKTTQEEINTRRTSGDNYMKDITVSVADACTNYDSESAMLNAKLNENYKNSVCIDQGSNMSKITPKLISSKITQINSKRSNSSNVKQMLNPKNIKIKKMSLSICENMDDAKIIHDKKNTVTNKSTKKNVIEAYDLDSIFNENNHQKFATTANHILPIDINMLNMNANINHMTMNVNDLNNLEKYMYFKPIKFNQFENFSINPRSFSRELLFPNKQNNFINMEEFYQNKENIRPASNLSFLPNIKTSSNSINKIKHFKKDSKDHKKKMNHLMKIYGKQDSINGYNDFKRNRLPTEMQKSRVCSQILINNRYMEN